MSEEQVKNNVTLENGEVVDFGEKGKCFMSYDIDAGTVTAKVVTGQVITLAIDEVPSNVQEEVKFWGFARKLATAIITTEGSEVADKLTKEIAKLKAGKFSSRGMGGSAAELDDFQVAFALVNATGVVNTGNGNFTVPPAYISVDELRPHWVDVNDNKVIEEVLAYWDSLPAKEKTAQRKNNNFVRMQAEFIENGSVNV